jgi:hypothetical protein
MGAIGYISEGATGATTAPQKGIEKRSDTMKIIDFDTVCGIESLSAKARGLSGIIEVMALAARKDGGISISVDALEGLHSLALDVMIDAKDIHEKTWNASRV